jgi:hypothetical protein
MGKIFHDATPEQEQEFIEERRKIAFLAAGQSPLRWLSTADRHKRAADIIYEIAHAAHEREMSRMKKEITHNRAKLTKQGLPSWSESRTLNDVELSDYLDSELLSEYLLLVGYALECIFKGCLLTMRPELVKDRDKLDSKVITHNLVGLCNECEFPLSPLEQQLLNIITWHVEWRKYPVPKNLKDMPSPVEPNQRPLDIPGNPFHKRKVQSLVNELYQRGYELLKGLKQSNDQAGFNSRV